MKQHNWYSSFLLIFVCLLFFSYQNHFDNPFFLEDENTIVHNNSIRKTEIKTYFTDKNSQSVQPSYSRYQPGFTTLNSYDLYWGGEEFPISKQFHKTNFIFYVFLAILLYAFFLEIFIIVHPHKWNSMFALFATSLFCLHTTQAETLNYISARGQMLATVLVILAFIFYMYKTRWRKYYHYLVPIIIGFTFHVSALLFIPILFFYKFIIEEKDGITKEAKKYIFIIFPLITFIIAIIFYFKMSEFELNTGINSYLQILSHDIQNFFFPFNLTFFQDFSPTESFFDLKIISTFGFIFLFVFIAWRSYSIRQLRPVTFGIIWFFFTHHFIWHFHSSQPGEHSTFLPYIGLVLALTCAVAYYAVRFKEKLESNQKLMIVFCALPVISLMIHSYGVIKRNEAWDSKKDFWTDALEKSPNHPLVNFHYGLYQKEIGNNADAKKNFEYALQLQANFSPALFEMALMTDDLLKGTEMLLKAFALDKNNPDLYVKYVDFLLTKEKLEEAKNFTKKGLEISKNHVELLFLKKEIDEIIKKEN